MSALCCCFYISCVSSVTFNSEDLFISLKSHNGKAAVSEEAHSAAARAPKSGKQQRESECGSDHCITHKISQMSWCSGSVLYDGTLNSDCFHTRYRAAVVYISLFFPLFYIMTHFCGTIATIYIRQNVNKSQFITMVITSPW